MTLRQGQAVSWGCGMRDGGYSGAGCYRRGVRSGSDGKGRRKRKPKPLYRRLWFQAAGIGAGLAVVAMLLWLVFRPPSQERLYQSAARVESAGRSKTTVPDGRVPSGSWRLGRTARRGRPCGATSPWCPSTTSSS